MVDVGKMWMLGKSYLEIKDFCSDNNYKIYNRKSLKEIDLYDVIEICDKGFGYSTILLITTLSEFYAARDDNNEHIINLFKLLSSEFRYGLPDNKSIIIYEIGFSDRVVAQKISKRINIPLMCDNKKFIRNYLINKKKELSIIVDGYPQVFIDRIKSL